MPTFKFLGLLVILLVAHAWCKPAKSSDGVDYSDDDPADYNDDTIDDEDDSSVSEVPPQILSRSESIHVRNGSTIWLPCNTKNADNYTVTWQKGDEILYYDSSPMTSDSKRIVRLSNNTLVIYNATSNDTSNDYECTILHPHPVTIKHQVLVESGRLPPIRVTPGKEVEVTAGESITLGCETRIQPTPVIRWYHENERVPNDLITDSNHITITNISRQNGGHYRCLADNHANNPPVESINVVVNYIPEIETKGKWVHTGLGMESQLACTVHAHPGAKVTWLKDEKKVMKKKGSIEMKENKTLHVLNIMHTEKDDFGDYTCVAENALGRNQKTISLTGLPSRAIILGGERTKSDTGLILKWQLESYSPITEYTLEYRRKGEEKWNVLKPAVTNGKGNMFVVEHLIEGLQSGSYEAILTARNDFGWSPASIPHVFTGEYADEQAEQVKGSTASRFSINVATLFLVVSTCAFTSL